MCRSAASRFGKMPVPGMTIWYGCRAARGAGASVCDRRGGGRAARGPGRGVEVVPGGGGDPVLATLVVGGQQAVAVVVSQCAAQPVVVDEVEWQGWNAFPGTQPPPVSWVVG